MHDIEATFGPLELKTGIRNHIRALIEEPLLFVKKATPVVLSGKPGLLRLGGGLFNKIVFGPDDDNYLGRCFLMCWSNTRALVEVDRLAEVLKPQR